MRIAMLNVAETRLERDDLRAAWAAMRARPWLVVSLLALAGLAWWWTADRMAGMDAGPGADLGTLGWFIGVWVVMMAAMMLPSLAPALTVHSRMAGSGGLARPLGFASGYLLVWAGAGVLAYALFAAGKSLLGDQLAWDAGGQWLAGAILLTAAAYELSPPKRVCLGHCREPGGSYRARPSRSADATRWGAAHGLWCVGCCWALMAALFALGVMGVGWMVLVASVIALEKTLPSQRAAIVVATVVLLVLAVMVLVAPSALPGFTVPGGMDSGAESMQSMG